MHAAGDAAPYADAVGNHAQPMHSYDDTVASPCTAMMSLASMPRALALRASYHGRQPQGGLAPHC